MNFELGGMSYKLFYWVSYLVSIFLFSTFSKTVIYTNTYGSLKQKRDNGTSGTLKNKNTHPRVREV